MAVRLVSQEEPLPGYRLLERLGRGGFGEVWKVEAPGGLHKAMKFVFGDLEAMDEDSRPAEQELKALKRVQAIRHPYILSLERYDIIDGQLLITMELADKNLWDRFRECRSLGLPGVPREELLRYMEETAEALDLMNNFYHIQHLDIKPQNLFLVFNHVKVGDFGLAKVLEGVQTRVTGGVTPVYAAPETFNGWVSQFSDQYSLAIVFQELLTGARPFTGGNTRQLLMQHLNGTPELDRLPQADRSLIGRALNKKPDERWPSCTELVRALRLSGTVQEPPPTNPLTTPIHAPADSAQATRMALGGSGRLGTDPLQQQPAPPPLVKPSPFSASTPLPPMPQLVTVNGGAGRLVTQGSANAVPSPAVTLQRPIIFQTARMGSLGIAPPEKTGDGALFPALVVAVGQTGRAVVEQLKQIIRDRFGGGDKVPNVRFLYVDTDPATADLVAGVSGGKTLLTPREVVYAKLHRPAHYMTRDALPPTDSWMPPGSLYRLARAGGSAGGVRAFGRLALLDNYRLIAQRLRQEIETFLTDDAILQADKTTGLGMRTNRPRAYVIAGLAGGTGSGMFLDLAYLIRHELRQVGYMRPEVAGVFFVPQAEATSPRNAGLGNTFAALAELHHFDGRGAKYNAAFDKTEAAVHDPDPAFARTALVEYPKSQKPAELRMATGLAARALFQEVLTAAGRVVDEVRDVYRKAFPTDAPTCQTFGLFRLSWPRPEMLTASTRRFAQRILQRWTAKEAAHLREPIAGWLQQQWRDRRLGIEDTNALFNRACRDVLREEPDRVFDAFIDPLRTRSPAGGKLDAASACEVLDQLLKVVGKPDCENDPQFGSLYATLTAKFEELAKDAETHLASMAVSFIEQPQYRLAGAEEAVRQISDRLKKQIDTLEPKRKELDTAVRTTYGRLFQTIGGLGVGTGLSVRKTGNTAEVMELLRLYPRKRLHLHVVDMCLSLYRKLHGNAPEFLREINYCRSALADMHAALKTDAAEAAATGPGKLILPEGCKTLDEAADIFLANLSPEELMAFDQAVQKEAARKFRGLVTVCLKAVKLGAAFRELLLAKSHDFLDAKLPHTDPATVFLTDRPDDVAANLIREAFDEAQPRLTPKKGPKPDELVTLAAPPGAAGDRVREIAQVQLPGIDVTTAPLPDDIAFYREYPKLLLAEVPQLGEHARDAFVQMVASEHPPHARIDVAWTVPNAAGLPPT